MVALLLAACGGDDEPEAVAQSTTTEAEPAPPATQRPRIVQKPIPFGTKRKQQMRAYSRRHYGIDSFELTAPKVVVQHITVTDSFGAVYNTFANNSRDPELRELPGVCSHYVVDKDGTIYQLVKLGIMCRHTVGLNHTSIGIEHVGRTDAALLGNRRQLRASLALSRWLRCRFQIAPRDVIGHNESLSSPHHRERVKRLRTQTHGDMKPASMRVYRRKLGKPAC